MLKKGDQAVFILWFLCTLLAGARADKIDELVKGKMVSLHIPGVSIAVVKDGKVLLARGYGLASLELSVPATDKTVYEIGSMTKQFTATAIMMLVEEGKIGLDDKISKHLAGLPETWKDISVKNLLNHTSGIRSYTNIGDFVKLARIEHTKEEIVKMVSDLPLDFTPGTKWVYSNTNYYLLGMIVEKESGKSLESFLEGRIFNPLAMDATRTGDPSIVIPNRASGYMWGGKFLNAPPLQPTAAGGAGFLVSNVLDLAKWDAALYTNKLLTSSSLEQMWTSSKLNDGKKSGYGFGWGIKVDRGHKIVSHGGGTAAFSTIIDRYVVDKLTVIVLTNRSSMDPGLISRAIAGTYLPLLILEEKKGDPDKAIEDKNLKTTERLKSVFTDAYLGKVDEDLFTSEAIKDLIPKIKESKGKLEMLGALKSFILIELKIGENKGTTHRYRAVCANQTLSVSYFLNKDGKISGILLQPE